MAIIIAIAITMLFTPLWIKIVRRASIGQQVRADGPQSHLVKQGTPTMGGVVMVLAVLVSVLVVVSPIPEALVLLIATLCTAALGFIDDVSKVVKERSLGLTPKAKLIVQFLIASIFCLTAVNYLEIAPTIQIPFIATLDFSVLCTTLHFGEAVFCIPWLYLIFVDVLLVGMC
ncbi:MAG: phospho-N-acetylmuramoyl-pentapeptide-transferase, partial [Eggerthellaceae bacterium]|nr:phospho-N-acetylmuramoyl-pentapeptide-transferase [Eggerthellaceae bacterium]